MDDLTYQKKVISDLIHNAETPIHAVANHIVSEKKATAKLLHTIYGIVVLILLIILYQTT